MRDFLPRTKLFARLEESQPPVGAWTKTGAREMVEIIGDVGFDYVVVDMMSAPTSWETAADLAAAALQFDMTPSIRLQSYPWGDEGRVDTRLAADVHRALAIGFQVVGISVDGPAPIVEALKPRLDNHYRSYLPSWDHAAHYADDAEYAAIMRQLNQRRIILPIVESARGLARLEEIVALSGVRFVELAMGDLIQELGCRGAFDHERVQEVVREAVEVAAAHGVGVVANVHGPRKTPEEIAETVTWMRAAGVAIVELPAFNYFLNPFYREVLRQVRDAAAPAAGAERPLGAPDRQTLVPRTRLFERLERGQLVVGTYTKTRAREMVEIIGDSGFDYAIVDMMSAPTTWETAADLAAAALEFDVTPWVRLQSYPWGDEDAVDTRLAADVHRAQALGFQVIQISTDGPGPIAEALKPRLDNHHRSYLPSWDRIAHYATDEEYAPLVAQMDSRRIILPSIESLRGLGRLEEILALPGVRMVKLGMGDLTQQLGQRGNFDSPVVRETVRRTVAVAAEHGAKVVVNVHGPRKTPEELAERAAWLAQAGVAVVEVPAFNYFLNRYYGNVLDVMRRSGAARAGSVG